MAKANPMSRWFGDVLQKNTASHENGYFFYIVFSKGAEFYSSLYKTKPLAQAELEKFLEEICGQKKK